MKLKWQQAPVKTQWGDEMVVASVAIDKDHTLDLYCERDQASKVETMFALAAQPAPVLQSTTCGEPVAWRSFGRMKNGLLGFRFATDRSTYHDDPDQEPLYTSPPAQRKPLPKSENSKHKYNPHKKYPWFCADCGYAEHELLMHTAAHGIKE